jgi:hypothetical protein
MEHRLGYNSIHRIHQARLRSPRSRWASSAPSFRAYEMNTDLPPTLAMQTNSNVAGSVTTDRALIHAAGTGLQNGTAHARSFTGLAAFGRKGKFEQLSWRTVQSELRAGFERGSLHMPPWVASTASYRGLAIKATHMLLRGGFEDPKAVSSLDD